MKKVINLLCIIIFILFIVLFFGVQSPLLETDDSYHIGSAFLIKKAILPIAGFIDVQWRQSDSTDIQSIGATDYMPSGTYRSFHVELDMERFHNLQIGVGDTLQFVLYKDNGDKVLDMLHDTPVKTWYGKEIKKPFTLR